MNTQSLSNQSAAITEVEAYDLALSWYEYLDCHAPLAELLPLLADEGLNMLFPEGAMKGLEGFHGWYERVINLFFDEIHTLKQVKVFPNSDRTIVKVVVRWEASRWNPPAPTSERIVADAYQTWELVRSPKTGKPVILTYTVDSLEYENGSARL